MASGCGQWVQRLEGVFEGDAAGPLGRRERGEPWPPPAVGPPRYAVFGAVAHARAQRIGRRLLALAEAAVGEESKLLLLAVPTALPYHPTAGMAAADNAFLIKRTR